MRTVPFTDFEVDLARSLSEEVTADYVYMYPPRQAYAPVASVAMETAIDSSLARSDPLNLYVHVPFCQQICSFCNLYAVVSRDQDVFERYVDAVLREADWYAPHVAGRQVDTVYVGGGTPSQLSARLLDRLIGGLERRLQFDRAAVPEVAIEVAPDTVTAEKLAGYRAIGVTRVNLGLQTTNDLELGSIGRRHDATDACAAIELALSCGFENVCVDLIYGLQGQTPASWRASVETVIGMGPPTVCAYPLTLRPATGYAARGYHTAVPGQYAKYDFADAALRHAGYRQETHVRWARGKTGGYLQKQNHWAMGCVLGLGAGARGYLWDCDYRNGYSARHRMPVLREWFQRVEQDGHGRVDGFLMDDDERVRKALILGLQQLDRTATTTLLDRDPAERFAPELAEYVQRGLVTLTDEAVSLTPTGTRHRDVLVQPFFSSRVREALTAYGYDHG